MKKIMFSEKFGLEQAVLAGTKDMTRRDGAKVMFQYEIDRGLGSLQEKNGRKETLEEYAIRKSPYKVGDMVAVAQRYADIPVDCLPDSPFSLEVFAEHQGWSNKMYVCADLMPHRIKITDVRFEQLKCISDEECIREGIYARNDVIDTDMKNVVCYQYYGTPSMFRSPRDAFASLINKMCGAGMWEANRFVYVYSFKLVQ